MALVQWRPRGSLDIRDEINRLFGGFLSDFPWRGDELEGAWFPKVDISETKNDLVVTADLPGLKLDDVSIHIENNVLTLKGEKKKEEEKEGTNYYRVERSSGKFTRSFALPNTVDANKVKATFKDGVLTVTLAKTEAAKGKRIPIEAG
ncbi:MAG: Hsp20/alpha crystallin family protein [Candidatus Latescibacteria bacterium]|nr:Hsp20/alpha crystallin family protein [Candidatus Latescibacterota bacterium]